MTVRTSLPSPIGVLTLVASDLGLQAVVLPGDALTRSSLLNVPAVDPADDLVLAAAASQLAEYFAGRRLGFDVPLDLQGTRFQQRAWQVLTGIPFGETISYAEQARRMGTPTAVRAVGGANGRNPIPVIVPCHRVIGSDGRLTGYGGGLPVKQWLLDHEQRVLGSAS